MSFNINSLSNFNISNKNIEKFNIKINNQKENFKESLDKLKENNNEEELKKAAKDFESYFINMIFKEMRKTVDYSKGILKRSKAEEIFQEMFDEQVSKEATKFGGIGIANAIYKQLSNKDNFNIK